MNCAAFMFDEIRYELNGVEIDRCKNVGITTMIKNGVSLTTTRSKMLENAGWIDIPNAGGYFDFCVPLNMLLGFCEDYKRIVINAHHELILIRSRDDKNAIFGTDGAKYTLQLYKVQWRMPHVTLEERHKLSLLRILENGQTIIMSYRSWDLYEYPMLQATTKHTWSIKAATQLEKPRYVIFALQTDKKNRLNRHITKFDDCKLTNFRLYLNSDSYPYDNLNLDFNKNRYSVLYDMYAKFRKSYYGAMCSNGDDGALYDKILFFGYGPFVVIDCSHQNESIKSATIDVRIDFECSENVPENTSAYCLIIHDRIVQYNPLTNVVRKLS
ncbi:uncharacterized protein LOC143306063 [Osmia lignaria lignaria]|uniref:uncharacterized protein LOC143306063 n=1 Tax=Osmia lignaria lignaria TaxID=1437193 RepID=UPI00402B7418